MRVWERPCDDTPMNSARGDGAAQVRLRRRTRESGAYSGGSSGTESAATAVAAYQMMDEGWSSGYRRRFTPHGPEADLVDGFLCGFRPRLAIDHRNTVFREPSLPSGFPDLVLVTWHEPTINAWRAERAQLLRDDLRLLHILSTGGPLGEERLAEFNFFRLSTSLERLIRLGMVISSRNGWRAAPLRQCFAVRRIIAFEAKISDWSGAVEQASVNRWFASESYVLLPRLPRSSSLVDSAVRLGVGIWISGERRPVLRARHDSSRQPVSLASWLFNEWVWHGSIHRDSEQQGVS